jgi:hypothetical protein
MKIINSINEFPDKIVILKDQTVEFFFDLKTKSDKKIEFEILENASLKIVIFSSDCNLDLNFKLLKKGANLRLYTLHQPLSEENFNCIINHQSSFTNSFQISKSILEKGSQFNFQGKILTGENLKEILATQINKNLLLDPKAKLISRPELEIYSKDVECNHGSSSGFLSNLEIFYLQSRGLTDIQAKKLILEAFKKEIYNQVNPICLTNSKKTFTNQI